MKISVLPQRTEIIKLPLPKEIIIKELLTNLDYRDSKQKFFIEDQREVDGQIIIEALSFSFKNEYLYYRNLDSTKTILTFNELEHCTEIKIVHKLEIIRRILLWLIISALILIQLTIGYLFKSSFFNGFNMFILIPLMLVVFLLFLSRISFLISFGANDSFIRNKLIRIRNKYLNLGMDLLPKH